MDPDLSLEISSTDGKWSEQQSQEARSLFLELKSGLDAGSVKQQPLEGTAPHRGVVEAFRNLFVSGISLGGFGTLFEILKTWLESRPTVEVTLKYPDGSEVKVSKISLEAAQQLHEEHARKLAALRPP